MKIDLHYGKGLLCLQIPEANIEEIIRPWEDGQPSDNPICLKQMLTDQQVENFQRASSGKRLCVLLDDGTREEPFEDIFGQLLGMLQGSALVRFLICTGTHNPDTVENNKIRQRIEQAAGQSGIRHFEIRAHDCEQDRLVNAGKTSRGTEIMFNALADDADVFLVLSDVKVHYFAGYSNPVKNFVPGICAYRTAEQNHRLALDDRSTFGVHPWHQDPGRRNNPLAEDQLEGMRLIVQDRPVYALVTISTAKKINWARFGPAETVSGEAFDIVDQHNTHTVKPVTRLIVSPGGLPNDVDLYIAQRALELTRSAVSNGGEVLFLAACPDGIGEKQTIENFYQPLTAPIDEVLKSIEGEYKLYSHKPYKFAQMIKRLRRIWVYSEVPDSLVEAAHLYPTHQPQVIVDGWLAEEPDVRISVVDGANKIALYARDDRS
jgi:nickel-dependent lactate racemase